MLAALLLCLGGQERVDIRQPAAIGEVMARRLSETFGVTIKTDPTLADVPLIFNVKNVTFDEFRPIAAKGLDASWKEDKGTWILYRTKEQIKAEDDAFLTRRSEQIRKLLADREPAKLPDQAHIDKLANDIKYLGDDDLMERMYEEDGFPDEMVGDLVFNALGADYLAGLPIDKRIVYTSDGRERTKKLPVLEKLIEQVSAETSRFKKALVASGAWNRLENSASYNNEYLFWWLDLGDIETIVLELISTEGGIVIHASGFDKTGAQCAQYYDDLYETATQVTKLPKSLEGQYAPLSKESIDFRNAYRSLYEVESEIDYYDFIIDYMKKLPDEEPLALEVSDVLLAISDKSGVPLAGRLSDDILEYEESGVLFPTDDEEGISDISRIPIYAGVAWLDEFIQIDVREDIVRIFPESPLRFQTIYPRRAIGDYVRANIGRKTIDLNRVRNLAVPPTTSEGGTSGADAFIVHMFNETENADLAVLSTWAELSASQKQQASTPRGIYLPLTACSDLLRFEFNSAAVNYGQWSMLVGSRDGGEADVESEDDSTRITDWILTDTDMKFLDKLQVNIRSSTMYLVRDTSEEGSDWYSWTAEEFAEMYHSVEDLNDEASTKELLKARYSLDEALLIELRYDTPSGVMLDYARITTRRDLVENKTLNQLPAQFLQKFQAALAKLRNGGLQRAS